MRIDFSMDDRSEEVLKEMNDAKERALEAIGLQAEGYAQMLAPHQTGRLKNSISHAVDGDAAVIGTNVEYAIYQEFGTSRTKAQPYLKPAVEEHIDEYKNMAETMLRG